MPLAGAPAEHLKSDAGFESAWAGPDTSKVLTDENLAAFILVMEPATLRPPHYADADILMAVLQGTGLDFPFPLQRFERRFELSACEASALRRQESRRWRSIQV